MYATHPRLTRHAANTMFMVSMHRGIRVGPTMSVTEATDIHRQARVRLDDAVVVELEGLGNGLGAVGVVFGLAGGGGQ
jgi:hypothetical protein